MGNIISDSSGNIRTLDTNGNAISNDVFTQNITDALFELNLYNTGNYYSNVQNGTIKTGQEPRSELDYTDEGRSLSTSNIDVKQSGRHSINNTLIDIIGLPYTDKSLIQTLGDDSSEKSMNSIFEISLPGNKLTTNSLSSDKLYNLKRGFCMASTNVPIDIVGIDIPSDDPEAYFNKPGFMTRVIQQNTSNSNDPLSKLTDSQKNIYKLTQDTSGNTSNVINNCLTWGDVVPPTSDATFDLTTPIPDIDITKDTLNDLSKKNVYGNVLTPACTTALDKLMMNSYVSPEIKKYSKLSNTFDSKGALNHSMYHNPTTGDVLIDLNSAQIPDGYNLYNATMQKKSTSGGSPVEGRDHNAGTGKCGQLEEDLCNYHYYYDINDGILFNPDFNPNKADVNRFNENKRYLQEHIPDCRCLAIDRAAIDIFSTTVDRTKYLVNNFDNGGQCNKDKNYGLTQLQRDLHNNAPKFSRTQGTRDGSTTMLLFNENTGRNDSTGYRRQFDPMSSTTSGLTFQASSTDAQESSFLYAPLGIRLSTTVNNNYTCNIQTNINVSGVAGSSLIDGVSSVCNFNQPGAAGAAGAAGTPPVVSQIISLDGIYYMGGGAGTIGAPIESNDLAVNAFQRIIAKVSYPGDSVAPYKFLGNYQFALYSVSDPSKIIILKDLDYSSDCNYGNLKNQGASPECLSPYNITVPFIYGPTIDNNGTKYNMVLQSKPGGSNAITTTNSKIITIKQYSMRIGYTELKVIDNVYYLHIGINLNTDDNIVLGARVILTPVDNAPASSIPPGCSAVGTNSTTSSTSSTGVITKYYSDLISSLIDGTLVIGENNSTNTINPNNKTPKYYYTIMLNETIDINNKYTGGYTMLYDQQMPLNQQCVVDFSSLRSKFISVVVEYIDSDDNDEVILLSNKDSVKFGSTIRYTWTYNSVDNSDTTIDIFYDTNVSNPANSPTAVKLASNYLLSSNSSITNTSNYLVNTFECVCPIIKNPSIIIYGVVTRSDGTKLQTPITTIGITQGNAYYKNWKIIKNTPTLYNISPDMNTTNLPLVLPSKLEPTIDNYFNLANSTSTPYKYIIYDPSNGNWFGGNQTLTTTDTGSPPLYTIFEKPIGDIALSIVTLNGQVLTTKPTLQYGQEISLTYTILPTIQYNTDIQVVIGGDNGETVIYSFPILAGGTPSQQTFTLFYDLTITNPYIKLTSYNTFSSSPIKFTLEMSRIPTTTLTTSRASPPYQVILSTAQAIGQINASTVNVDEIINNMNITYKTENSIPDNKYYVIMNGFATTLSVLFSTITFGYINLNLPLELTFSLPSPVTSNFTNVTEGNQIESFYSNLLVEHLSPPAVVTLDYVNEIHINTFQLDLSDATLSSTINISLMYSGYKKVYVQNLEIIFGQNRIDGSKFNLKFSSDSYSNTYYQISEITIVGLLSSQISFLQKIPGLTTVKYAAPILNSSKTQYALIVPLTYLNGYYVLPESYNNNLSTIKNSEVPRVPIVPVAANVPPEGMPMWQIILIVFAVLAFIGGCIFVYIKFIKKDK